MVVIREQTGNEFLVPLNIYKNGLVSFIKKKYAKQDISLKHALFDKINLAVYEHEQETQEFVYEFGSKLPVRQIRAEIIDYIDNF